MTQEERFKNLRRFLDGAKPPSSFTTYLSDNVYEDDPALEGRYLVVLGVFYTNDGECELDHTELFPHEDLGGVRRELEDWLFADVISDYSHEALVIDLHEGKEVPYTTEQKVLFEGEKEKVCAVRKRFGRFRNEYEWVDMSYHRTEEGARQAVEKLKSLGKPEECIEIHFLPLEE
jgi:hypothetical protein